MRIFCLLLMVFVADVCAQSDAGKASSDAATVAGRESCSIPVKKYAGQRRNNLGETRGEIGFTLSKVEGNTIEGILHMYRSARDCGGDHRVTGTCSANQITATVHRTGIGECESRVALKLDYASEGLVGKLGRDLINNPKEPPNLFFGR